MLTPPAIIQHPSTAFALRSVFRMLVQGQELTQKIHLYTGILTPDQTGAPAHLCSGRRASVHLLAESSPSRPRTSFVASAAGRFWRASPRCPFDLQLHFVVSLGQGQESEELQAPRYRLILWPDKELTEFRRKRLRSV